jgi:hypothetical protein
MFNQLAACRPLAPRAPFDMDVSHLALDQNGVISAACDGVNVKGPTCDS